MRHVINAANGKNQKRPPTATALPRLNVRYWPILLKKSAMVSTVEKYALEIEIFTLSRGFAAQISHSDAQKRHFEQSVRGQSGSTDFFNRIGRLLPVAQDSIGAKVEVGGRLFVAERRSGKPSIRFKIFGRVFC